jgi:hypothetical protein
MFLIRFADFRHGGQALQIAGISPWILTVSETGQSAFFHDLFHEGILCDIMLLEKEEEEGGGGTSNIEHPTSNIEVEENEEAASLRQGPLSPKVRLKKRLNRE